MIEGLPSSFVWMMCIEPEATMKKALLPSFCAKIVSPVRYAHTAECDAMIRVSSSFSGLNISAERILSMISCDISEQISFLLIMTFYNNASFRARTFFRPEYGVSRFVQNY